MSLTLMKWFILFNICIAIFSPSFSQSESMIKIDVGLSRERLSNSYSPYFLSILQIAFGSEIISQGGSDSVDDMFAGIDLDGKTILDIGSGFGGVEIYLGQKHQLKIIGVDREPFMTSKAKQLLTARKETLFGDISFQTLQAPNSLSEFLDETFDIVFCKEMLYHVPFEDKEQYIHEMFRVLKPNGKLMMAEWFCHRTELSELVKNAVGKGFDFLTTPQALKNILEKCFFIDINYRDVTDAHIKYTKDDLIRVDQSKQLICEKLGEDAFNKTVDSWQRWLRALESHELQAGVFTASKPCVCSHLMRK